MPRYTRCAMDIQELVGLLKAYHPEKIILFGSHAHGAPHEGSDLDVAIVKSTQLPFHDRLIEVRRMVRTTQPIDFFVFTKEELEKHRNNFFISEILTKGKVVYDRIS